VGKQEYWDRELEERLLARLRGRNAGGPKPLVLVYTRQSVSDFDDNGEPVGPSLSQQLDTVLRLSDLQGLEFEHYQDADRSGKETSRRPGYLNMMARIRSAVPGIIGAVGFYDQDRLHRNDMEFNLFMAEMAEQRILVFDASGLISHAQKLPWKIKAIVAQDERERISKRVRDNLRFLKRKGHLLGVLPQGYRRVDGQLVEDPQAGPVVREIFKLYATGQYSLQTLAEELNRRGIAPLRNPERGHNRPLAKIFTYGVLKDFLKNPSYLGKVMVDGQLVPGLHPALVDQATWDRCAAVRVRNQRRTSKTWNRYSYPLTPVLRCGKCGGKMHGEASSSKSKAHPIRFYYGCFNRRRWSSRDPEAVRCDAKWVRADELEEALREDLRRCLPTGELNAAYRERLAAGVKKSRMPANVTKVALKKLEERLGRIKQMYEWGHIETDEYMAKQGEINEDRLRIRELASARPKQPDDFRWCELQILDLLQAWDHADAAQRARLICGLYERIEVEVDATGTAGVVAVPHPDWTPFFREVVLNRVVLERETSLELATSTLATLRSTN
jgi:site-specific DNA recombinase